MKIRFGVPGEPKPQGSKDQFGRESCKKLPAWRSLVSSTAHSAMSGKEPIQDAVSVRVCFTFSRPKGHFNKNGLKEGSPFFKQSKPDLDKLLRALGDALTGIVIKDDSQIVSVCCEKRFGPIPGMSVCVEVIENSFSKNYPKEEEDMFK